MHVLKWIIAYAYANTIRRPRAGHPNGYNFCRVYAIYWLSCLGNINVLMQSCTCVVGKYLMYAQCSTVMCDPC